MILSGDLKDFSLADVLQLLLQQRKSGVLNLENGKEKAELYISQGNITGVRVNAGGPEAKVREMLVESGRIGAREMADLESISADMARPLLATLIAKGYLNDEEKEEWLQIISEDMVCDLFSWQGGHYEFGTGVKGAGVAGHMNLSADFACMEGMRRIDEWPRLREGVPDGRSVFNPTGKPFEGEELGWDRLVLGLVDGRRSVEKIGRQVPFGTFRLSECMVNLWNGGYIAPLADAEPEREYAREPDPESERDRKTAVVLGVSVLFFVAATAVRLIALWMNGLGAPELAGNEARIYRALARENVETFLMEEAARRDAFPEGLDVLTRGGALTSREVHAGRPGKAHFQKAGAKGYILR